MENEVNNSDKTDEIFRKLEPHLKCGLSLYKASLQAQIPKSTVYDLYQKDKPFSEKVDASKNYHSVLVTNIVTVELERIATKQRGGKKLQLPEIRLVQWVATNSRSTRSEYDRNYVESIEEEDKTDTTLDLLRKIIGDCENSLKGGQVQSHTSIPAN